MYQFTPDEFDTQRAHHQAVMQDADNVPKKRIGNLGEIAFEQFCREYLPTEMWEWNNEDAIRRCNPESFLGHDFEVFGYEVDVKTSRDVSAFLPKAMIETDSDDDILVMAWHRDNEDSLILLGWEWIKTLETKVKTQEEYSGEEPERLKHIAMRPMNDLKDLGPNAAYLNQKPENPFKPGDRVVKRDDSSSVAVVVEVLPPETQVELYGQELDGEAVRVAFPNQLNQGPGDWRTIDDALLSSYCDDQDIKLYTYKHENLVYADNPYTVGDRVIKSSHNDPDTATVVDVAENEITVTFDDEVIDGEINPGNLTEYCEKHGLSTYTYSHSELKFSNEE